jgi:hypothetical protein
MSKVIQNHVGLRDGGFQARRLLLFVLRAKIAQISLSLGSNSQGSMRENSSDD